MLSPADSDCSPICDAVAKICSPITKYETSHHLTQTHAARQCVQLTNVDDTEKYKAFLKAINEKEHELKSRALFLRYLDPSRTRHRTIEEVAEIMGLPLERLHLFSPVPSHFCRTGRNASSNPHRKRFPWCEIRNRSRCSTKTPGSSPSRSRLSSSPRQNTVFWAERYSVVFMAILARSPIASIVWI